MTPRERVAQVLRNVQSLPTLPDVVVRLLQHTDNDSSSVRAIAATVERDVTLATRVLKLVNSPLFGIGREVTSVQQALLIVGLAQLRSLILSSAVTDIFEREGGVPGFSRRALWEHSVRTAVFAKNLASRCHATDPEVAFTAGLVHDVGKVVLDRYLPREFAEIVATHNETGTSMLNAETAVLGVNHAQIGEHLALHWNLPAVLQEAIGYHHSPGDAPEHGRAAGVISLANQLDHHRSESGDDEFAGSAAAQLCGLTELQLHEIRETMSTRLEEQTSVLLT